MIDNNDNDNLPQSILSRGGCLSYALAAREEILADGLPYRRWWVPNTCTSSSQLIDVAKAFGDLNLVVSLEFGCYLVFITDSMFLQV
jgi:hypothetical protein